jgi:hypothetical protein
MGGGQQPLAEKMLADAMKNGTWLCLKNLHLVNAWLPDLEKALSATKPHNDFRLWLTSEASDSFPAILLQQSYKITFESPPVRHCSCVWVWCVLGVGCVCVLCVNACQRVSVWVYVCARLGCLRARRGCDISQHCQFCASLAPPLHNFALLSSALRLSLPLLSFPLVTSPLFRA